MKKKLLPPPQRGKKKNKGFTLVEVLVSIAIFSVSILGLLSVMASGIINTNYAKNKMIAGYLAQEGVEYMRNLRDDYIYYSSQSSLSWSDFETQVIGGSMGNTLCASANGCTFNAMSVSEGDTTWPMINLNISACTTSNCGSGASNGILYINSVTGNGGSYYSASGTPSDPASMFVRQIKMIPISANEIKIFSTVYWTQGSNTFHTTLSENLFNWF